MAGISDSRIKRFIRLALVVRGGVWGAGRHGKHAKHTTPYEGEVMDLVYIAKACLPCLPCWAGIAMSVPLIQEFA